MGSNPSKSSPSQVQAMTVSSPIAPALPEPEVSDEERKHHNNNMKKLKIAIRNIKGEKRKESKTKYLETYVDYLSEAAHSYFRTGMANERFRLEVSRELATSGTVTILCDIAVDVYEIGFLSDDGDFDSNNYSALDSSLSALTNFSDADQDNTPIICNHPKFLERSAQYLRKLKDKTKKDEEEASLIDALLSIIHNVAMFDNNVSKVRSHNYVEVLTPYLDSPINNARLIAIAGMADIVNEEESELLQKGQDVLGFLKKVLKRAMESNNRMHPWLSWPVWELTRVMRKIARNDTNKKALVDQGFLPELVEIAGSDDLREQREAIGTLWTLSFEKDIQKTMIDVGVVDVFVSKRNSTDPEIAKAAKGALWTMREELSVTEKYKDLDMVKAFAEHKAKEQDRSQAESAKGHVMVSYQWSNQQVLIKVRDQLRANGFKVWMDIDDMAGSTLEAMAKAVEEAEVVLVCYSKKYKDSENCRAEAEYAFEKRKQIVPLRMEQSYKADGWLGIIIGAKKFYDFSGKYSFDSRTDDLVKELRGKYSTFQEIVPQNALEVYSQPMALMSSSIEVHSGVTSNSNVKLWSSVQVSQWLDKHGLERSKFGRLQGMEIAYLQFLLDRSPDYFNKALIEQLKIKDLLTMAKFTFALEDTNI